MLIRVSFSSMAEIHFQITCSSKSRENKQEIKTDFNNVMKRTQLLQAKMLASIL